MKYITSGEILVIFKNDLAKFIDYPNENYAFSIYKNTCVVWDNDLDHRVLGLVDHMPDLIQEELVAIYERKGDLNLLWFNNVPSGYEEDVTLDVPDDTDFWEITKSITVAQFIHTEKRTKVLTEIALNDLWAGVECE